MTTPATLGVTQFAGQMAVNTLKLLKTPTISTRVQRDYRLFCSAYAALADYYPEQIPVQDIVTDDIAVREEIGTVAATLMRSYGNQGFTTDYMHNFYRGYLLYNTFANSKDWSKWNQFIEQALDNATNTAALFSTSTVIAQNIKAVANVLDLNEHSAELLEFQILRTLPEYAMFYESLFNVGATSSRLMAYYCTGTLFGYDVLKEDSELLKSGLVNYNPSTGVLAPMSQDMYRMFAETSTEPDAFFKQLVKPAKVKKSAAGSISNFNDTDRELLESLLADNYRFRELRNVNILVYGSKILDKKAAVYNLVEKHSDNVYTFEARGVPHLDLPTRVYLAQRFLDYVEPEAILIVDQADDVLSKNRSSLLSFLDGFAEKPDDTADKLELDEVLLEENPVTTIWITHSPERLNEENVGRFLFHCEARAASRGDRRAQIEATVKDAGLSDSLNTHLSKYHLLNRRQVDSAVRLAGLVRHPELNAEDIIKRSVHQSQRALGREAMEELRDSVTEYSLSNLNLKTPYSMEQIIDSLKKRQQGSLCFYGIPGSGKSALAEHIAMQVDKPLIMRKASDLLSKWVGDNEKNMAAMFREAEETDSVLLLDEADSYLRDRTKARASYEVSATNELLVAMERFRGIFIAATNLFEELDSACLRRFTFKLEFLPLTDEQRWEMFKREAKLESFNLSESDMDTLAMKVSKIQKLAPGDFATVKRQSNILGSILTPDEWIEQLTSEAEMKLFGLTQAKIGFHQRD